MHYRYEDLAGMIDHSLLHPTLTDRELEEGCRVAMAYQVASVCVKPYHVARAAEILRGARVAVGTVIGFPHGANATEVKRFETEVACRDGATEIDMVINNGKVFSGDWDYVAQDIRAVVTEAHQHKAIVKVIFETDFLPDDALKTELCRICEEVHADYVKTSTGFGFVRGADGRYGYQGATEHDLQLMRAAVSPAVGVKASGGVRDLDALIRCKELGCGRVGATASAVMLDEYRRRAALPQEGEPTEAETLGRGGY